MSIYMSSVGLASTVFPYLRTVSVFCVLVASTASRWRRKPLGRVSCLLVSYRTLAASAFGKFGLLRGPRRGIGSVNCTLQIKIFCVFINCATKLQYKYQ